MTSTFVLVDCSMAPPSSNWQRLLRLRTDDIEIDNEAEEQRNEKFGDDFIEVGIDSTFAPRVFLCVAVRFKRA